MCILNVLILLEALYSSAFLWEKGHSGCSRLGDGTNYLGPSFFSQFLWYSQEDELLLPLGQASNASSCIHHSVSPALEVLFIVLEVASNEESKS